ncbi:helix-turn-helix domain-containing protein [Amycolatopsis thermoflava]|uniref:helix-turn-helix domain-containing protein n=1 Tax=Amycolatopsis thermoflava TaxID=84480 RepID=UPI00041C3B12|nr:helix-turn-helix transcriptional regulator [Amycolatopsis thermoflava]
MTKPRLSLPFDGGKVRALRETAGLSLTDLAQRLTKQGHPTHRSTLSKIEIGTNGPSPRLFNALVKALKVKPQQLLADPATERRSA